MDSIGKYHDISAASFPHLLYLKSSKRLKQSKLSSCLLNPMIGSHISKWFIRLGLRQACYRPSTCPFWLGGRARDLSLFPSPPSPMTLAKTYSTWKWNTITSSCRMKSHLSHRKLQDLVQKNFTPLQTSACTLLWLQMRCWHSQAWES